MDELVKANQRALDLQYQLTDVEEELNRLREITARREAGVGWGMRFKDLDDELEEANYRCRMENKNRDKCVTDTDAATIAALLEELKEVDFEAWKEINDISPHFQYRNDCIQSIIQRAIVSKGGDWLVESWNSPKGLFHRAEIIGWKGGEYKQDAYTSAAAILAAYIEAVRTGK